MNLSDLTNVIFFRKGGQKEVYTAEHPTFGKVAYKKILTTDALNLERTKREIRAASILNSDHVPKIFAHNCDEVGATTIWVVEQLVQGETIRDYLSRGKIFSTKEVVLFLQTLLELSVLCEQNSLVHRDIKPENITIDNTGKFWLLDFGIARHLTLESLTQSAQHFGLFTLGYASTEQFRNLKKDIDIRADLFSIAIVAHEMLTGENYYRKNTADPIAILHKMEKVSIAPFVIKGDAQFQLSAFICMLGDFRRTRRPRTAVEALEIFNNVKGTLIL